MYTLKSFFRVNFYQTYTRFSSITKYWYPLLPFRGSLFGLRRSKSSYRSGGGTRLSPCDELLRNSKERSVDKELFYLSYLTVTGQPTRRHYLYGRLIVTGYTIGNRCTSMTHELYTDHTDSLK